jgi:hypothetical protein
LAPFVRQSLPPGTFGPFTYAYHYPDD